MVYLTKAQRKALKRIFDRGPIWAQSPAGSCVKYQMTYRQFRATVTHGWDCVMVRWCNMWVGIEKDGYTHT